MTAYDLRITVLATTFLVSTSFASAGTTNTSDVRAKALLFDCFDPIIQIGVARFRELGSEEGIKEVIVKIRTRNNDALLPGKHVVHIHETGECTPCGAANGHFDPGLAGVSSSDGNHPFHMGDLENIMVGPHGAGRLHTLTTRFTISDGPLSIMDSDGSAIVVHTYSDTYCPDGQAAGCAGGPGKPAELFT